MSNRKAFVGLRAGRLTILAFVENGNRICLCDCGQQKLIGRTSKAKSCGCLKREISAKRLRSVQPIGVKAAAKKNITHGFCRGENQPEYRSYLAAKARCNNPNDWHWEDYGGRGIEFHFASFEDFLQEVGERPTPKRLYSIGRLNNEGHYEIGNVKWQTSTEQNRNRRTWTRG